MMESGSRWVVALNLAMALGAVTPAWGAVTSAADPPVVAFAADGAESGGIPKYRCELRSSCPRLRLIDSAGNLVGCTWDNMTTCTGNCVICSGEEGPVYLCVRHDDRDCIIGLAGTSPCGVREYSPCFYSLVLQLPQPCNCALLGSAPSETACVVWNCQADT